MWYKLAAKSNFVLAYHGTSEDAFREIQKSGYLRTNGIANLTVDKEVAASYAHDMVGGQEDVVVLSFKVPKEFILSADKDNLMIVLNKDLPLSYLVKAQKVRASARKSGFDEVVHTRQVAKSPQMKPQDYQKMKEEVQKNLRRNPSAYIPAYMRDDPDFARYKK